MRRRLSTFASIVLSGIFLTSILVVVQGCNTDQSPKAQVDDAKVTAQVKSKLASDINASSLTNISVNTTNGVVNLTGQVESAEIKDRAQTAAASIAGVTHVNNNLQVTPKSTSAQ